MRMVIGGVEFRLNPAAISAIRYRAEYGCSIVNDLAACDTAIEAEGRLLRMAHMMIEGDRPELLTFAALAHEDKHFMEKALEARAALLSDDPLFSIKGQEDSEPFDEYQVLALMASAGIGMQLIYEVPILHIVAIAGRYYDMMDTEKETYRPMDASEMSALYPRAKHG